jgi:septin family protein
MVTTISAYCQQRGVTKQFVYEYIRKKKFEYIELPIFTEVNGQRIDAGTQKFLSVPEAFEPELDFPVFDSAATFVDYLTDYPELANRHKEYFKLTNPEEKAKYKAAMYADIESRPEAERKAFFEAQDRLNQAMLDHMSEMQKRLKRILKKK